MPWAVFGQTLADQAWNWDGGILLEELDDLDLIPDLFIPERRVP